MLHAGVVQAGVQFILFAGLLFVLLSADSDPLLYAVRVLPLSASSQRRAASALSDVMRGVFLCALKVPLSSYLPLQDTDIACIILLHLREGPRAPFSRQLKPTCLPPTCSEVQQ